MTSEDKQPISNIIDKLPVAQVSTPSLVRLGTALGALTEAGLHKLGISKIFEYNAEKNHELTKNLEKLATEFESQDPIVTIPVEIAQPIMERLTYVVDNQIADLFIKLLSSAGHESTSGLAHPSLIHVIDQLSPDEAIMLEELKNFESLEYIEYGIRNPKPEASGSTRTTAYYFSRLSENKNLTYPENSELYMENLISLGLVSKLEGWFVGEPNEEGKNVPNAEYKRLEDIAKSKTNMVKEPFIFYSKNGILKLTNKGKNFIKVASK